MDIRSIESLRLAAVKRFQEINSPQDLAYDDMTRMAAQLCNAPMALITLVDDKRQWFKAKVGMQASETPREHAFCAHAIKDPGSVFVVKDAAADERFSSNPLVVGEPHIRFYAGAPLVTSDGHALGTLCVIDTHARELTPAQLENLQFMAKQVISVMEGNLPPEQPTEKNQR